MALYQAGETVRLKATITDTAGDPVDPASTKIIINKPDGTAGQASTDMSTTGTGAFYYDYLIPSDAGTYNWNVTATGVGARVTVVRDSFVVEESI